MPSRKVGNETPTRLTIMNSRENSELRWMPV